LQNAFLQCVGLPLLCIKVEQIFMDNVAKAIVLGVKDTGRHLNYNPVLIIELLVYAEESSAFKTSVELTVPRVSVPKMGDKWLIKYNPAKNDEIEIL
jgi:hypothetical protein